MPDASRPPADRLPGRRAVLGAGVAAGAAVLLAGCGVRVGSPAAPVASPSAGADELARERAARDADALHALATRAAALRPADRALLVAVAADHHAHAAALRPPAGRTTPGPATTAGPGTTPAPPTIPARPTGPGPAITAATALATLDRAERTAAAAATAELDRVGGDAARLLASVAASRSLHVSLLSARLAAAARPSR